MGSANLTMGVKGIDKTGAAFNSVKNRARATGAQIRSMLGGALAAAGAYLGFRSIKGGIDELGHLSDIAQKTSMSVDELTKTATAMNILGIQNMGIEQLAKSMDYLQKTTGRSGLDGFLQTIGELGKIEDAAKRGQEAMRIFGRSGMEFMPLINAASDGTDALKGVIAAMGGVSQASANTGDAISDSMTIAAGYVKSIWLDALGSIARSLDDTFAGGAREAAATAGAYFEHWVKSTWRNLVTFGANCGIVFQSFVTNWVETLSAFGDYFKDIFGAILEFAKGMWNTTWDDWKNGRWFGDAPDRFAAAMDKALDNVGPRLANSLSLGDLIDADTSDLDRKLKDKLAAIKNLQKNYDLAAMSTTKRQQMSKPNDLADAAKKTPQVRNTLIMAGNEANKLAALGPQYQNETKKQTKLLEEIAANTKTTAENTEENQDAEKLEVVE